MLLSEILKLAMDSFRAAKTRFMLTALGMVIGTASVILVVTIGMTGRQYVLQLIQKFGTNSVEVEYAGGGATDAERVRYTDYLTREDEKAVDAQLPGVMYSSPVMDMHDRISFGGGVVKDTLVLGVSPQYELIHNLIVTAGRFFDDTDDATHQKAAVVSELFAKERYGGSDASIGRTFEISGIPFTVIGVFKMSVNDFGQSEIADQTILIPYSVVRYFTGTERVNQIYFSMRSMDDVPDAAKEIVRIIKSRHRDNSVYKAQTLKELLDIANQSALALTAVLVLVAAVTLAVGGVGIMNIMLANVRSRIREIGIRKALGATLPRNQAAIPSRGPHHLAYRRSCRHNCRHGRTTVDPFLYRLRSAHLALVGYYRPHRCHRRWRRLRHRSRHPRRADGPRRRAQI